MYLYHVYVYIYIYLCLCVCVCVCMYVCMYVCILFLEYWNALKESSPDFDANLWRFIQDII